MRKLLGKLACLFSGHKRGIFSRFDKADADTAAITVFKVYACPRCGHETRYKATGRPVDTIPGRPEHDMTTRGTPLKPGQ